MLQGQWSRFDDKTIWVVIPTHSSSSSFGWASDEKSMALLTPAFRPLAENLMNRLIFVSSISCDVANGTMNVVLFFHEAIAGSDQDPTAIIGQVTRIIGDSLDENVRLAHVYR